MKLLVVDDDPELRPLVGFALRQASYLVLEAASGEEALTLLERELPDLMILDVNLPGIDGFEVLRRARTNGRHLPILMLTVRGEEEDLVRGLDLGADDYLTKPFSPRTLLARVRALLRRAARGQTQDAAVEYGEIVVDTERHTVVAGGQPVTLTAKEFLLLNYLLNHRGRVLSRDLLLTDVWGYKYTGGTRTVDVHVRRLREKLPTLEDALVTVKQFGYKLLEEPPTTSG